MTPCTLVLEAEKGMRNGNTATMCVGVCSKDSVHHGRVGCLCLPFKLLLLLTVLMHSHYHLELTVYYCIQCIGCY